MDQNIVNKLYDLVDVINNNENIKEMTRLKQDIYQNADLKKKLYDFRLIESNNYSLEYVNLKKDILAMDCVRRYKELENQLYMVVLYMNSKLNSLVDRKCVR